MNPGDPFTLADAVALGTAFGIAFGAIRWLRDRYRETLGRPRLLARKLALLAPGVTLAYVRQLFGEPTFADAAAPGKIFVWVEPEFYLQACVADESVLT